MASLRSILRSTGFRPARILRALSGLPRYYRDRSQFLKMNADPVLKMGDDWPILDEWHEASGGVGAYCLQDLTVARWIHQAGPQRHIDVGSRLDGFVGHLSIFRKVDVLDIREAPSHLENVTFHRADLMLPLAACWVGATDSLSCLHTLEHFGLGRYGDTIHPRGHLSGLAELKKILAPGGVFYLSVPMGEERVEFNAHRVFAPETVLDWFDESWEIIKTATISDQEQLEVAEGEDCRALLLRAKSFQLGLGIIAVRKTALPDTPR
jgi:SAM-dependent methyltransferase